MTADFITFEEELLNTSREAIEFSKKYYSARKRNNHSFNQLQVLINKSGLHISRKSVENKITELMANGIYGEQAIQLNKEMLESEAEYKSYELIIKAYLAHCSALQSVIKTQISSEISENVRAKYRGLDETA